MSLLRSIDLVAIASTVLPALAVAVLRICDVSLNVFRTVFVVQERRLLAALVAAAEAGTWLAAAGIVFAGLTPVRAIGYVAGVAAGTAIGVEVTRRLRLGMATVRIYAKAEGVDERGEPWCSGKDIARAIHAAGYAATVFDGRGYTGPVQMVLSTVRRRDAEEVVRIARTVHPGAFAAVDNSIDPAPGTGRLSSGRV
jgi:uncharacterized protein YebE (UPF0316 family)